MRELFLAMIRPLGGAPGCPDWSHCNTQHSSGWSTK